MATKKKNAKKKSIAKKANTKKKNAVSKKPVKKTTGKKKVAKKTAAKKKVVKKTTAKSAKPVKAKTPATTKKPARVPAKKKSQKTKVYAKPEKKLVPSLQEIKDKLFQSRQELFGLLQSSKEMERNLSDLNFSNEIDLAASLEGREMAFTLSSRDRNELKLIDEALFKIDKGSYGACEACSKQIGLKRLKIIPLTAFCIECQESKEHS